MMYTADFIDRIKAQYPDSPKIHRLADEGHWDLGKELRLGSEYSLSYKDIIAAQSLEELQSAAIKQQLRKGLYDEFMAGLGSVPSPQQARLILDKENKVTDAERDIEEAG